MPEEAAFCYTLREISRLAQPVPKRDALPGPPPGPCCLPPPPAAPTRAAYGIQSVSSQLMLDVPNSSTSPGQDIDQWPSDLSANQQWYIFETPPSRQGAVGGLGIGSYNSGMVLNDPSANPGIILDEWTYNGAPNQQWGILWSGSGYEIQSVSSGLVINVPFFATQPGTAIDLSTPNEGTNQQWEFSRVAYPNDSISITGGSGEIHIHGWGAPQNTQLRVYYMGFPYEWEFNLVPGPRISVDGAGAFDLAYGVSQIGVPVCQDRATRDVTVLLMDDENYVLGVGHVPAEVWLGDNLPPDITACDANGCISEANLLANICGTLAGNVVGYSVKVGGMPPVSSGLARTASDPPATSMTPYLPANIFSVSKTMTAIAILQLLAKNNLTVDTKIDSYIYSDWSQGPNINQITFGDLLTHKSGFGQQPSAKTTTCRNATNGDDMSYSALEAIVAKGVSNENESEIGAVANYGNCNFALLRELMPALLDQRLTNFPDGTQRAQQSSTLYINYMNANVFQPVGIPVSACKAPNGTGEILSYPFPAGSTKGAGSQEDWTLKCGATGWELSADEIFKVINDLATGNALLTKAEKQEMFTGNLGWDGAVRTDCPNPYVCKNGSWNYSKGAEGWRYAGVLKCNVPVVVVVNSPLPSPYEPPGNDIIGLVANALQAAKVDGPSSPCP
jgi:hypothetical protein